MEVIENKAMVERYPIYKDSSVEWIGDVPEHWGVKRFKRIFFEVKKRTNIELNCGSISFGKVVHKNDEKIPEATKKSYQVVLKGDFLVNPLNLNYDLVSLRIALSEIDVVVSSGYIVLNTQQNIDKQYFKWLLHRFDVAYMKVLGSGVRQTINFNDIGNADLVFPPREEQTAIAQFLDGKSAHIDQVIFQKEKQIELLKERRQILIHRAVTGGVNPHAKMKNSGVEWIGDIPDHWELVRFKNIAFTTSGATPESGNVDAYYNGNIPWVRTTDLNNEELFDVPEKITERAIRETACKIVPENTVCVAMYGGAGTIGKHSILRFKGTLNQAVCGIVAGDRLDSQYLYFYVKFYRPHWMITAKGSRVDPNISQDQIRNAFITLPPLSEQEAICKYLNVVFQKVDAANSLIEKQIEKLKEYKTTLINSAVTGKIKVA